jgi:hypothetical protein
MAFETVAEYGPESGIPVGRAQDNSKIAMTPRTSAS